MAAIKAFLNCAACFNNEPRVGWSARQQLALDQSRGFGADLSNVVALIEITICNDAKMNSYPNVPTKCNDVLGTKVAIITEIEAAKGNFLFGRPELKLSTLSIKELWSLVVQCFENLISETQTKKQLCGEDWLHLKELLHVFEWMRDKLDQLCDIKDYEEELLMVWSIAWLKLKPWLQNSVICGYTSEKEDNLLKGTTITNPGKTEGSRMSQTVVKINSFLEPQLHKFNLIVRQFWNHVGFLKVTTIFRFFTTVYLGV